jgi:hypothetical protein
MKCMEQIPTLWQDQETTSATRFQQFPGKNSRELTPMCSAHTLCAFGQEGNILSICCSTVEFLLHCIKIILTAVAYQEDLYRLMLPSSTPTHA